MDHHNNKNHWHQTKRLAHKEETKRVVITTLSAVTTSASVTADASKRNQFIDRLMHEIEPLIPERTATKRPRASATPIPPITTPKEEDTAPVGRKPGERWNVWPMLVADIPTTHHAVVRTVFIERFAHSLAMKEWCDIVCCVNPRDKAAVFTTLHATHPIITGLIVWLKVVATTDDANVAPPIFPVPAALDRRPPMDAPGAVSVFGALDDEEVWHRVTTAAPELKEMLDKHYNVFKIGCTHRLVQLMAEPIHRERMQYWHEQTTLGVKFTYKEITERLFRCALKMYQFVPQLMDVRNLTKKHGI